MEFSLLALRYTINTRPLDSEQVFVRGSRTVDWAASRITEAWGQVEAIRNK